MPPISGTKLTKISCCDWSLMMVRPSVQPPMAVAADGAVVVVIALVVRLHDPVGLARQRS